MFSLQSGAHGKHIQRLPIHCNLAGMRCVTTVGSYREHRAVKVPGCVLIAQAQRCFRTDLPDRRQRETIGGRIATGELSKIVKEKVRCSLKVGKITRPRGSYTSLGSNSPVNIEIANKS